MRSPKEDLTGREFCRLTVLEIFHGKRYPSTSGYFWMCKCVCGSIKPISGRALKSGKTLSCGCLSKSILSARQTTHGAAGSKIYWVWREMKARCLNPTNKAFKDYGARGITVCERWMKFENFLADMGEAPNGMWIDRYPDKNGNYEPGNCRWATPKEQQRNRRSNRIIDTPFGQMTLAEAAEISGICNSTLRRRVSEGCDVSELFKPTLRMVAAKRIQVMAKGDGE